MGGLYQPQVDSKELWPLARQPPGAWALPARSATRPIQRYSGGMLAAVIVATTTVTSGRKKLRCWCRVRIPGRVAVPSKPPLHKSPSGLRSLPLQGPSLIAGRETPKVTFMYMTEGVNDTGTTRCWPQRLGSSFLVAHVIHYPPSPTRTAL